LGDEIIARTWVGSIIKNFFERHTEILRANDQKVLARARTMWCPVDHRTGRPTRVGDDIREQWSVPDEKEQAKL
jgi:acyl-CoA thioester hydrolase